jgi:hypothetical protein
MVRLVSFMIEFGALKQIRNPNSQIFKTRLGHKSQRVVFYGCFGH